MSTLISASLHNFHVTQFPNILSNLKNNNFQARKRFKLYANSKEVDVHTIVEDDDLADTNEAANTNTNTLSSTSSSSSDFDRDLKKVVQKTAATFAPRASTASKNPAVPGSTLYTIFEVQAYISMLAGGALSYNLVFPSTEPDLWRLMGMWSIWMFTIPSLRARDCSKNEKEALNYLFILVPLINVIIPFFVKSFSIVWSADTVAFFAMYAWKLGWLKKTDRE